MAWGDRRDAEYEKIRTLNLILLKFPKVTKALRAALQMVVILRAGAEVTREGLMQAEPKQQLFATKVRDHQEPFVDELEALAVKLGVPLPEFIKDSIRYSNAKKKPFVVASTAAASKNVAGCEHSPAGVEECGRGRRRSQTDCNADSSQKLC